MSRTLTLPDYLYNRLEDAARRQGIDEVAWIAARLPPSPEELERRGQLVADALSFREQMGPKYGEQPDSVAMIREERDGR